MFGRLVSAAVADLGVMLKPPYKRLALVMVICSAVVALAAVLWPRSKDLSYDGRLLAYWFNELPPTILFPDGAIGYCEKAVKRGRTYGRKREKANESLAAIRVMGTNAIPFLLQKLSRQEPPFRERVEAFLSKCGMRRSLFPDADIERGQAVTALIALNPLPPGTLLELRNLSNNSTNNIGRCAAFVLEARTNLNLARFARQPQ
jgi:hypothetical protein